jgi:alpha-D-ribose 1-methylphosphonate 5-triphosphate synthase subunit PhnH
MSVAPLRETQFDPVVAGQGVVRRLLDATANAGTVVALNGADLVVRPPRLAGACALLLAVLDNDVSVRVLGPDADAIGEYLRFNTGARSAPLDTVDFVLVTGPTSDGQISRVTGRRRHLDMGPTIVYAPDALRAVPFTGSVTLAVAGPRVGGVRRLHVAGLDREELGRVHALGHAATGIELWLVSAERTIAVIPRSSIWICEG